MSDSIKIIANAIESKLQNDAERLVQREVIVCLSHMVSTIAGGYGGEGCGRDLSDLAEQAFNLITPIADYEEAATQAGWTLGSDKFGAVVYTDSTDGQTWAGGTWQDLCEEFDVEPYDREVYEHWAVSTWLAEKLIEAGERVDTDFSNLNVWARTTTGQSISMDSVIRDITRALHA